MQKYEPYPIHHAWQSLQKNVGLCEWVQKWPKPYNDGSVWTTRMLKVENLLKTGMWELFKLKNYELNLMLKMKMRMVSIQTILNIILNVRTVLKGEKKSLLFPGTISQGHSGCAFKKGQLKWYPHPEWGT